MGSSRRGRGSTPTSSRTGASARRVQSPLTLPRQPRTGARERTMFEWSDYEVTDEKLRALYAKGKRLQWDASTLDWNAPIDPAAPVHAGAFPLLSLPIFQRLKPSTREELTAKFL